MSTASSKSAGDSDLAQQTAPTQQLNRSCESCRSLKVRCLPDPGSPSQCQRCAKAKRACVFVAPQRRRPRKRTDSRVAQLEKEMRQMRSLLKDRLQPTESDLESSESDEEESRGSEFGTDSREALPSIQETSPTTTLAPGHLDPSLGFVSDPNVLDDRPVPAPSFTPIVTPGYTPAFPQGGDIIDRGVISLETAGSLLSFFITDLAVFAPMIVLPPETSASQIRRSKPVLFLSILAAAAIAVDANLATTLNHELVRLYAEQFFINGGKSLELIQALLLMIIFYYPPDSPVEVQFYQYAHIAATMALEIGLASKRRGPKPTARKFNKKAVYDDQMAEDSRTILWCYHFASHVAMKTRRPNLLLFNDWMNDCVAYLEASPVLLDRQVASWFELQRIVDEALASFGLDDTSATSALTDSRVQAIIRFFDNRVQSWEKNRSQDLLTVPINFEYHYTKLAVYELAIGEGYRDPNAIQQNYYTLPSPNDDGQSSQTPLSAVRIDLTVKWMNASQELLDLFLGCDTEFLRKIPNLIYIRVGVAIMSLLKIHFSVKSGVLREVITPQAVNADTYLDALAKRLAEASDNKKYRIPSRWYYVIAVKGRSWFNQFQQQQMQKENDTAPLVNTSLPSPHNPVQLQNPPDYTSSHQPQSMEQLRVDANVRPMPSFHPLSGTYGTPPVMNTMWSPNQSGHQDFLGVDHYQSYQQPIIPPHYAYEAQPKILHSQAQSGSLSHKTDMEVDGWTPGQSVYGIPSYPGGQS